MVTLTIDNLYVTELMSVGEQTGENIKSVITLPDSSKNIFFNDVVKTNWIESYPEVDKTQITSFKVGKNVSKIESSAFSGMSSLASIYIPNNVKTIANDAFAGCPSTMKIYVNSSSIKYGISGVSPENIVICVPATTPDYGNDELVYRQMLKMDTKDLPDQNFNEIDFLLASATQIGDEGSVYAIVRDRNEVCVAISKNTVENNVPGVAKFKFDTIDAQALKTQGTQYIVEFNTVLTHTSVGTNGNDRADRKCLPLVATYSPIESQYELSRGSHSHPDDKHSDQWLQYYVPKMTFGFSND